MALSARWTRVNIGEAIPGVPTPLSWSLWQPAMEHAFWWSQVQLGVAARGEYRRAPVTGCFLGHPAISVDVSLEQIGRLPGYDPEAFAEQYFNLPRDPGAAPARTDPRVLARVAVRAPFAVATLGRRVAANAAAAGTHWTVSVHGPAPADPLAVLEDASRRFRDAMAVHTLQGVLCQGAYERVTALAGDLAPHLVSADGDLAEAAMATDLWAVAHGDLDEGAFLRRHGYHGPEEGELSAPSWREDPEPLRAAAERWAAAPADRSPTAAARRRAADRRAAEAELLRRLPRHRRAATRALLAAARRFVAQREAGKGAFLRHLDVARFAARHLGEEAVWCTLEELRAGQAPAAAELARRRAERAEHQRLELPLSWVGEPDPVAPPASSGAIGGTGASPGVVTGRARLVLDPAAVGEPIGPDEVLVARTTDPSWVTLFLTAGALVIDVGGALSHGAIVARELGIPCVIGTGDGTARIADGDTLVVDGTAGTVTVRS